MALLVGHLVDADAAQTVKGIDTAVGVGDDPGCDGLR
jgi:hypothetical protein